MRDTVVDTEVIRDAVRLACRAPSLHNSQPWRWVAEDDTVQLFLDKDRVLYSTDHSGREALIGCGAVLDHFRVAMAAAGWTANVDRFPNPNNHLILASIDFSPMEFVTDGHRRRADAILQRRTDRLPFAEPPDWESVETQLRRTVTPTPYVSMSSPTSCVRSWQKRLSSPNRFGSTTRPITPNSPGGQGISRHRRHTAELAGVGGRKRPRRRRTQLPGHTPTATAASSSVTTTPRSSCCRRTTTNAPACCGAAKCFPPYCSTPRWLGWPRARSPTSPSCGRAEISSRR